MYFCYGKLNVIEIMLLPRLTHSHQNLIGMSRGESLLCTVLPHAKRAEGVSHCMSNMALETGVWAGVACTLNILASVHP